MAIGLFTLLLAQLATTSTAPNGPILVQGVRDRDRQIRNFVQDLTPTGVNNQLARFESPVCPAVFGLSAEQRTYITDRIRQVAKAAEVPVAKAPCDPNIIAIVTGDKRALMAALEKQHPEYYPAKWSAWQIHDVERDPYPVAAWQSEGTLYVDGTDASVPMVVSGGMEEMIARSHSLIDPLSRIRTEARPNFLASVIVVQVDALKGLTTTQFADYVAMRAFIRSDPRKLRASSPDSILKIIDTPMGAATPLTLTAWDMSFLKSFYASSTNVYAGSQRSDISWRMKRELEKTGAAQQ